MVVPGGSIDFLDEVKQVSVRVVKMASLELLGLIMRSKLLSTMMIPAHTLGSALLPNVPPMYP